MKQKVELVTFTVSTYLGSGEVELDMTFSNGLFRTEQDQENLKAIGNEVLEKIINFKLEKNVKKENTECNHNWVCPVYDWRGGLQRYQCTKCNAIKMM